jgi:ribonuclease BN (tRNA processing enzyme)
VKVTIVPSSVLPDQVGRDQFLITYLINDTVAIDAGCLGFFGSVEDQAKVRHVLISHTHMDHVASLPIFVENCFDGRQDCVTILASKVVLDGLQSDIFNGRIWPDFIGMSSPKTPFMKVETIESGRSIQIDGLTITPVEVDHLVPTLGFVVDDGNSTVVIASDTGPTEELWRISRSRPNLKAIFLEAAFPNKMQGLADLSKHLTSAGFGVEAAKVGPGVTMIAVHIKARYRDEILSELDALKLDHLVIGEFGHSYSF